MRKHDVRKWLHAVLDLLPVILIPVFMIYSHRHTIDSGSIQVPQNQVVDFNQLVPSITYDIHDENISVTGTADDAIVITGELPRNYFGLGEYRVQSVYGHKYYFKFNYTGTPSIGQDTWQVYCDDLHFYPITNSIRTIDYNGSSFVISLALYTSQTIDVEYTLNIFDLTQMFGAGNEPTIEQFNIWFPEQHYDYTLSKKVLIKDVSTITFDDTDIMSQVVYQLYNSVDKYFNMGNVFNMTGVYDWFNLNIFNGNAPISIYIVWNIVLYEFVMDLLFLLYGLFMWFIDMVEKLMEKPLKSVK